MKHRTVIIASSKHSNYNLMSLEESRGNWKKGGRNSNKSERCSSRVLWGRGERAWGRRGGRVGGRRGGAGRRGGDGGRRGAAAAGARDVDGEFLTSLTVPCNSTYEVVRTGFVEGNSRRWSGVNGKRRGWVARIVIFLCQFLYVVCVRLVVEHCKTQTINVLSLVVCFKLWSTINLLKINDGCWVT